MTLTAWIILVGVMLAIAGALLVVSAYRAIPRCRTCRHIRRHHLHNGTILKSCTAGHAMRADCPYFTEARRPSDQGVQFHRQQRPQ